MDEQKRKQNNKQMLKVIGVAGGSALLIIIAFLMITIGAEAIKDYKLSKEEDHTEKEQARNFVKALSYIANNKYKESIGVDNAYNYVKGISSIEYNSDSLSYRAYAQKGELEEKVVSVTLNYSYGTVDNCISIINDKYKSIDTFEASETVFEEKNTSEANDAFVTEIKGTPECKYVATNPSRSKSFKSTTPNETYLSFTYKSEDNVYYSFNQITYNSDTKSILKDSEYSIKYDTNKVMYYVFEEITK